jgi:hypothetical protein
LRQTLRARESELISIVLRARRKTTSAQASAGDRLQEVQRRLPAGAALIEFCQYRPYEGRTAKGPVDSILRLPVRLPSVRARIAADLHDDIGASLSQIAVLRGKF